MILRDLAATVGRTPMLELERFARGLPGRVAAMLEMRNPCGSVKDRLGVALIGMSRGGESCVPAQRSSSPPAATPASAFMPHSRALS